MLNDSGGRWWWWPEAVVVAVAMVASGRLSEVVVVVAEGHFCHLEGIHGRNGEIHHFWEGMVNSLNQKIHVFQFYSIGNQTTQWNSVNGIDHSNSVQFRWILPNQTPPKMS